MATTPLPPARPASSIPAPLPHEFEAVLGKTGSGKSNRAKVAVESWLADGRRVGVIDITDAWWGLKLGADGKASAHDVVIFGGRHADVDLAPGMAAPLGQMLAKATFPWILCTAKLGENAMRTFLSDFFEELYLHLDAPLHLVMDEADEYAPQTTTGAIGELFGRVDRIVRRGRVKGFRVMMLTQRPAALNKNILAQADRLTVFKLTLPHDHKAVEGWIKAHGDKARGQQVLDTLSSLPVGAAWVWAPEHELLERVAFPLARTYDSGRSPDGKATVQRVAVALKPADLERLRSQLGAVIEEAKANDPKLLKAENAALRKQLADAGKGVATGPINKLGATLQLGAVVFQAGTSLDTIRSAYDRHVKHSYDDGFAQGRLKGLDDAKDALGLFVAEQYGKAPKILTVPPAQLRAEIDGALADGRRATAETPGFRPPSPSSKPAVLTTARPSSTSAPAKSSTPSDGLPGPLQRILDALAWWAAFGISTPSVTQVAFVAGYKPNTGTFNRYRSDLKSRELIAFPSGGAMALTNAGEDSARPPETPTTHAALHAMVRDKLDGPLVKLLDPLLRAYPEALSVETLAAASGYQPNTGTFNRYRSSLKSLDLIEFPRGGAVKAAAWLFAGGPR